MTQKKKRALPNIEVLIIGVFIISFFLMVLPKCEDTREEYQQIAQASSAQSDLSEGTQKKIEDIHEQINEISIIQRELLGNQNDIKENLSQIHQNTLNHYSSEREVKLISEIIRQLDNHQVLLVQTFLDAIDNDQIALSEVKSMVKRLEAQIANLPLNEHHDEILSIMRKPELDFRHRLKVAIPLVPKLLPFIPSVDYEGELEIGTGCDIQKAWQTLKDRLGK